MPDPGLTTRQAVAGQIVTITVNRLEDGLPATGPLPVHLDGAQGPVIGSITTANTAVVTIPATIDPGVHTIDVIATNQTGQPIDVTQPVLVQTNGNSSGCPIVKASGIDSDNDGVDDACDAVIGPVQPPAPSGSNSSGTVVGAGSVPTAAIPASPSGSSALSAMTTNESPAAGSPPVAPGPEVGAGLLQPAGSQPSSFTLSLTTSQAAINLLTQRPPNTVAARAAALVVRSGAASPPGTALQSNHSPKLGRQQATLPRLPIIHWLVWLIVILSGFVVHQLLDTKLRKKQRGSRAGNYRVMERD